ncbi:MAG: hypothetical protein DHS20C02_19060 [Micavibrio sp.]|nr:MAG: hypothetical protein DHS20C02_19060 [Micavibrio sp.]
MKRTLTLALAAIVLIGTTYVGTAQAESPTQLKAQTAPTTPGFKATPKPSSPVSPVGQSAAGNFKPNPKGPVDGFTTNIPPVMSCMHGYSKTDEHVNTNGAVDRMECTSPIFECPHKSKVKNNNGSPANGQGIDIVKIPVGPVGDTNRFKIEYTCTYYWAQG